MEDIHEGVRVVILGLCGLALLAGIWLLRDWWRDNRAGGR
jgi:hypothetical protein